MALHSQLKDDILQKRSRQSQKGHVTPTLSELQLILWTRRKSTGHVNQVWPNLYLGDRCSAMDKGLLRELGITHILNAADGRAHVNTGAKFYSEMSIDYYGIEADDDPEFNLSVYFNTAARFIRGGLNYPKGKVLVHCAMGISRSATLVLAFLMICEKIILLDAVRAVNEHRDICPNNGFLEQLRDLDSKLFSGQ